MIVFHVHHRHVDDIDLYAGGMAEEQISGGMVGPTFACIIGQQFQNSRVGDRFWYEREDPVTGFTLGGHIRHIRLMVDIY